MTAGVAVSVITSGHDVADARLHREVAAMLRAGLAVEVLGLGDPRGAPTGVSVRTWERGGLAVRGVHALSMPWRARGRVLLALDPDAWLGSVPVRLLDRRRRLVIDVHEDYAMLIEDRRWARGAAGRTARALVGLALRAAARADLTVVADHHLPPAAARRRLVQRNLPDLSMIGSPAQPTETPRAVYVGDVRRSRGLFDMLEAVAASPGWRLDLIGPVAAEDAGRMERALDEGGLRGRVTLYGRLAPKQAWQVASGAWVGLSLLFDTRAFRDAVPSKVLEYQASGLPVIATDLPATRAALGGGGGVLVDPGDAAASAAAVLNAWTADPAGYQQIQDRAREQAPLHRAGGAYDDFAAAVKSLVDGEPPVVQDP